MDKSLRSSLKKLHTAFGIYYAVLCSLAIFKPFIRIFDRIDVWIMGMPLSQFWILLSSLLIAVGLGVHYYMERGIYMKARRIQNGE